jgi:hypothetical protein
VGAGFLARGLWRAGNEAAVNNSYWISLLQIVCVVGRLLRLTHIRQSDLELSVVQGVSNTPRFPTASNEQLYPTQRVQGSSPCAPTTQSCAIPVSWRRRQSENRPRGGQVACYMLASIIA